MEVMTSLAEPFSVFKLEYIPIILATIIAILGCFKFIVSPILGKKLPPGSFGLPLIGESISFVRAQKQDRTPEWILSRIKKYGPELHGKDTIKIAPLMKKITFNVTCSIFFGLPDGKEKDELLEDFTLTVKGVWAIPLDFPGTTFHRAMKARSWVCNLLSNLIKNRKKQEGEGTVDPNDDNIISSLLVLRDENGQPLLEEEILDVFLSLIMASHDTTAILLTLFIRHLSRDEEVSSKVLEEQNEVVKAMTRNDGKLNWSEIQMMKYTWRAAQELMRINPPMLGSFRLVTKDITFDGYDIPKGWQIFWVAPGTHLDNNIFENPDKFDPSRFENTSKAFPPYTYVPFGAGPRICAGIEFARVEALLIIHHFVTKYNWTEMVPDEPITREPMPYPAMGLPVKLFPKN
ncbi:Cytochrome P450 [Corchorus olitorius]|uniref:Cytochrome P450 n=1 Tax=Corchorus olitorius TaxID=93759 RepID=A0A1R3J5K7_9ROSI|nr:Cytochrome P450 [Corchorus olitorius]